jgi:uncharacterized protein (DUF58 family)
MSSTATNWFSRLLSFAPLAKRDVREADVVFPAGFLASVERLRLAALRAMGGGLREGHRLGAYKGGQLEFHGHRNYVAGDELRYVDWNSYARLGKPYVKEFAREEAGVLHILIDATPSMSLGRPSKWTFARRMALLFAHVAVSSKDIARLHVFDATGAIDTFPKRGKTAGTQEFLTFLERLQIAPILPGAASVDEERVFETATTAFLKNGPQRGRVMLLSDFWAGERAVATAAGRLSAAGHDLAAFHILAQEEIVPDCDGRIAARSLEEDRELEIFESATLGERYAAELEKHRAAVEEVFRRRGGQYLFCETSTPIEKVLIATLRQRRWVV